MDVFIPALKDANPFFDEIMRHSRHTYIFDASKDYKSTFKVVLIHWPEQLFNWKEPTDCELQDLEGQLKKWSQNASIMYVVHNLERHYGMTENYRRLYNLIESSCDIMIHLGNFSCNLLKKKYPNKKHQVIYHPLYTTSFPIFTKEIARKKLNIDKNSVVIIAPGSIRNKEEVKLVLHTFKGLKNKNKVLIIPRMLPFEFPYEFKGRTWLKHFIDIKKHYLSFFKNKYKKPAYFFNYDFLSNEDLGWLLSASDIVFIPRINILNSGNIFLGMTYKKIIVGPNKGNLSEIFKMFRLPTFNPAQKNASRKALHKALKMLKEESYKYDKRLLDKFCPSLIAMQWDHLIDEIK